MTFNTFRPYAAGYIVLFITNIPPYQERLYQRDRRGGPLVGVTYYDYKTNIQHTDIVISRSAIHSYSSQGAPGLYCSIMHIIKGTGDYV
jgi:hypothetical protein